ncbi:MAG: hypothetical protein PUJ51_25205 [Clostridiales bacterium]|uniref:hypothetical protein n=1 Tax=Terrisporobacter sp. TaxID=1965305 RepID=UPI002A576B61|nr:hypothetical protein [Terrisporobacter sp.]MDD7757757.1 hypothetical protein [Clostridiales bacterium]MDY3777441.1 hypothetical protein [Candidatus Onthovivens sp.]MDY4136492.1 hypothetical protein [Terrisporobacter sp.]
MENIITNDEIQKTNEIQNKMFEIEKSYLTKEEFINMLNNIDFVRVERCDLNLITGFICDYAEGEVRPLSKRIELS